MIYIYYKTESSLDNIIFQKILRFIGYQSDPTPLLVGKPGKGAILNDESWKKFLSLSLKPDTKVILMMDLDNTYECITRFLVQEIHEKFGDAYKNQDCLILFSVREIEAWLMADIKSFSSFFLVQEDNIKRVLQGGEYNLRDSKRVMRALIESGSNQRMKRILEDESKFLAIQGEYMQNHWDPKIAVKHSESLKKVIEKIKSFIL